MTYTVKEIFYTLQGEGFFSGRAAVFRRFTGCNLWSGHEYHRDSAVCQFCDTDFLGKIPLHIDIMKSTDIGRPCVHFDPDSNHARPFKDIAKTLSQFLNLAPKEYGDKFST